MLTLAKSHMSTKRNVIIIGQSGVGKSSLINMLYCGEEEAPTSNDTIGCTKVEKEYKCDLGEGQSCQVHDTIGLGEGFWGFLWGPKAEKKLKSYLNQTQPHLLVYCMPGVGLKKSHGRDFNNFKSVVGKKVPVVVVVTNLDRSRNTPEDWWSANLNILQNIGINPKDVVGHACITALPKADLRSEKRYLYDKSCQAVKTLIRSGLQRR